MLSKNFETKYDLYESIDELEATDKNLLNEAIKAAQTAYAPYSKFRVGAAVLLDNNEIIRGSNQENAAYPSGLCAERVALFYSGAHFPESKIKTIAVTAFPPNQANPAAVSPCGDCRQVMAEYEHRFEKNIRLIMVGDDGKIFVFESVKSLLPFMFNAVSLG